MRPQFVTLLAAAALLAGCANRTPPPWMRSAEKPRDENYHGGNAGALLKYDANKDGTLTRDELISGLKAAFAARGVPVTAVRIDDRAIAALYERPLVLVRPDGHVAWRGTTTPDDPLAVVDRVRGAAA